ncbi:MAG: hypothetical protein JNK77_05895 [Saprospiraceae bacterium]|nr:hypothetical protein [Saprospiraceae bacterium]
MKMSNYFRYTVKFICGNSDGSILARGKYWTAINVHNPNNVDVTVYKKFSVAKPGEIAGPISKVFEKTLHPLESMEIDNQDIFKHLNLNQPFVKGFAIIAAPLPLEVVAVYTSGILSGVVSSIDVEYVEGKQIK